MPSILTDEQYNEKEKSDIPWQVKAIGIIGIPGVITLASFYLLAVEVRADHAQQKLEMAKHTGQTAELIMEAEETNRAQQELKNLLQRICLNTSKDSLSRDACFR